MAGKIYTKTGDDGTTGLFGGRRVSKSSARIEAYGTVDELNSMIGMVRSEDLAGTIDELLGTIQHQLFALGSDLATPRDISSKSISIPRVTPADVACLEGAIDDIEEELPKLKHFILPGGTRAGSCLHMARTVCRRAERRIVELASQEPEIGEEPLLYLNRLSDLLFVIARRVNQHAEVAEEPWIPNPRSGSN